MRSAQPDRSSSPLVSNSMFWIIRAEEDGSGPVVVVSAEQRTAMIVCPTMQTNENNA